MAVLATILFQAAKAMIQSLVAQETIQFLVMQVTIPLKVATAMIL